MDRTRWSRRRGERRRTTIRGPAFSLRRAVLLVATTAGAVFASQATRPTPTRLVIEPDLLTRLQTLAEGLHQEIVLCLQGRTRGDVAVVDDFIMPVPRLSTPTRSSFDPCARGTLASWHNHPSGPSVTAPRPGAAVSADGARRLCVLSETDIHTAERLRHPFVVVSVDAGTWCWWTLDEIDRFAQQAISPGPPSPERIARGGRGVAWARPSTSVRGDAR